MAVMRAYNGFTETHILQAMRHFSLERKTKLQRRACMTHYKQDQRALFLTEINYATLTSVTTTKKQNVFSVLDN